MANYVAMIRLMHSTTPNKLQFIAQDVEHALCEMVRGAGCQHIGELVEFELMELVHRGKAYNIVASRSTRPTPPDIVELTIKPQWEESLYTPYTITTT